MPHINSKPLQTEIFEKLFAELEVLVCKTDKYTARSILSSLLTTTEQVMLTKRLAIILFLHKGMTAYEIWQTLHLSPSTVARIKKEYENGLYAPIINTIQKSIGKDFLTLIELLLGAGLPPRTKDRWQHVAGFGKKY